MTKMSSQKMALAATALMLLTASVAFLSNAGAQDRPPAQRPTAEEVEAPPAEAEPAPGRAPAQRPDAATPDAADAAAPVAAGQAGDADEDNPDEAADALEDGDGPAPVLPVPPPVVISGPSVDDQHDAFEDCVNDVFNSMLPNGPPNDIDFEAIDAAIFELCVPLLPEEEQAAIIARQPYNECVQAQYGDKNGPMTEEEYMAIEAAILELCVPLLPAEEQAQILAYNAYSECIDAAMDDDDYSQASYAYAAQGCLSVLPADLAEMEAMYVNYQVCLADNGAFENEPVFTPDTQYFIYISTPDGQISVNLGSEPSSVTIDSDGSSLTVTADGDAQVFEMNYEEHFPIKDAAYAACEDLYPYSDDKAMAVPVVVSPAESAVQSFARNARANR